jgi:hypothetical protein
MVFPKLRWRKKFRAAKEQDSRGQGAEDSRVKALKYRF